MSKQRHGQWHITFGLKSLLFIYLLLLKYMSVFYFVNLSSNVVYLYLIMPMGIQGIENGLNIMKGSQGDPW